MAGNCDHRWVGVADDLPALPGAYALHILLDKAVPLPGRWSGRRMEAGEYLYFGSARGPGGIRARCARHFRSDKKRHWHVDWLTIVTENLRAVAFPNGSECDLTTRALEMPDVSISVDGFGSSDCRRCKTHLLTLSPEISAEQVRNAIIAARR
ncbi:MAG: GIY-YIG nuclease family protein [Rhodospirillales bacterium]|nr:GIY-YIG nuclease family protein [Alphaproteobacteria bacterium]MBL6928138.1 GIY-YIG nuclease family protein [Rhodospirillales bacterium]